MCVLEIASSMLSRYLLQLFVLEFVSFDVSEKKREHF